MGVKRGERGSTLNFEKKGKRCERWRCISISIYKEEEKKKGRGEIGKVVFTCISQYGLINKTSQLSYLLVGILIIS